MQMRCLSCVLCPLLSLGIIGCAAGTSSSGTSTTAAVTPANLGGNWLLAGSLPVGSLSTPSSFGVAATFDISGSQVTGIAYTSGICSTANTVPASATAVVTGTIAADGTFSLTTPSTVTPAPTITMTLQGKVPGASGGSWTGSYSIAGSCTNPFTSAVQPLVLSGAIQSTSLPILNGTYTGTLTSSSAPGLTTTTAVSLKLQQGGLETNPTTGAQGPYSNILLSGTISLQGTSCQLTGTTQGATVGSNAVTSVVFGDTISGFLLMSDGSQLSVSGNMADTRANGLSVVFVPASKNTCSVPFNLLPVTLALQ